MSMSTSMGRWALLGLIVAGAIAATAAINLQRDNEQRIHRGKELLKYMNLSADPCHDFYEYACGNWHKYHVPSKHQEAVSIESLLVSKIDNDLQALLEEQVTVHDGITGRKIKDFYKSCLTAERNGAQQQAYFSEVIKENGGFPAVPGSNWPANHHNYKWQQVVAELRHRFGMDILIGMKIDVNHKALHENSIYLGEPSTLIPAELCNIEGTQRIDIRDHVYELLERQIAEQLKMWLTLKTADAKQIAADIITFEFELCSAMQSPLHSTEYNERRSLPEFTHYFNNSIDFNEYVTSSFGMSIYKPVYLGSENYFRQLIKTVQQHNTTTIANYIMYRALSSLSFPLDEQTHKRPAYCLQVLKRHFPAIVGDMYQRKHANLAAAGEMDTIFQNLKTALAKSLRSPWIEDGTSRQGIAKLSEITLKLPSYEKTHLNNLQTDRTNYWQNLAQVLTQVQPQQLERVFATNSLNSNTPDVEGYDIDVRYKATQKLVTLGWGLLQEPYYDEHSPHSTHYGTVGQRLGRALANAFDELNWTSDFLGLSNWDRNTAKVYMNRTECVRRQLSNYLHNKPNVYNNATRLRQLIATNSGLNLAFNAYLNWLTYMNPNNDIAKLMRETLPGVNFTNTQLFFIAYAQLHCRAEQPQQQAKSLHIISPLQLHTLERYAVNGPLRNFVEFARDFGCAPGAEMHPADKCVIY